MLIFVVVYSCENTVACNALLSRLDANIGAQALRKDKWNVTHTAYFPESLLLNGFPDGVEITSVSTFDKKAQEMRRAA